MSTYVMNFGTFELGGAALVDHTTHVLEVSHPEHENVALIVFRGPIAKGQTLDDLVAARIADEMVRLRGYAVLKRASIEWSGGPAQDIASRWINEGRTIYCRQAHLAIGDTWIVFSMSAPHASREACDRWFDEIMGSFTPSGPA